MASIRVEQLGKSFRLKKKEEGFVALTLATKPSSFFLSRKDFPNCSTRIDAITVPSTFYFGKAKKTSVRFA
ncbi:hypothetical protein AB4Z22_27465 [Paenibacillus sp. TAF58]